MNNKIIDGMRNRLRHGIENGVVVCMVPNKNKFSIQWWLLTLWWASLTFVSVGIVSFYLRKIHDHYNPLKGSSQSYQVSYIRADRSRRQLAVFAGAAAIAYLS
ncbi:hypothetical protein [Candidatus Ichthyocystis sparus]|uniref:hypothetical protein n=1 Tax=Candidatus Ichthyocystis sparus TaxID=1561004 RepID=UPI000B88F95B|nr:hypothetical protein [Candidatus Ichthyocystis sparus]